MEITVKRRILIVIYVILILITFKLLWNTILNNSLISKYNNGEYSEKKAQLLTNLNFPQSYIANYNYGNVLYQNGKYKEAMAEYEKALNSNVPKNRECSIRINYALAICKTVQVDETSQESIDKAIETYEKAIDILTEKGCANKNDDNGHSQKAEKLKKDIQKEIERLKQSQDNKDKNDENNEEQENNKNDKKQDPIEEKIQQIKENATQEQRKGDKEMEAFTKQNSNRGKNW